MDLRQDRCLYLQSCDAGYAQRRILRLHSWLTLFLELMGMTLDSNDKNGQSAQGALLYLNSMM